MTSGNFTSFPIPSIFIDREGRQRREIKQKEIDELAASIAEVGLINPIVITRDGVLVAGERRLTACTQLGWTSISVQFAEDLDELVLHQIELEENIKRVDLEWQDRTLAIEQYHALKLKQNSEWTAEKTAAALSLSSGAVSQHIAVARHLQDPKISEAPKFSTALGLVQRKQERALTSAKKDLGDTFTAAFKTSLPSVGEPAPEPERRAELINANFLEWAQSYTGEPFNFLHCDLPYGINFDKQAGQSSVGDLVKYDDSAEVYFNLIAGLEANLDRICTPSAHIMFWLSMNFYTETVDLLQRAGWRIWSTPLIWHRSDNKGLLPDPKRGPRQVYEVCLFGSRGDRKVVRAVSNLVASATTKEFHVSEKPLLVLDHFFRMFVDESTRMLDPTCGSGMSVKAAEAAGAEYACGIEMEPEFYERARVNLGMAGLSDE